MLKLIVGDELYKAMKGAYMLRFIGGDEKVW